MKILVTGATGFIGSGFVNMLVSKGENVHVIVRTTSNVDRLPYAVVQHIYDGSFISLSKIIEDVKPEVVAHLASLYLTVHKSEDIENLIESNIRFGTLLIEAMNIVGCKNLLNIGTSWQHFEGAKYNPVNLYAATKQAFEDLCKYYFVACDFKICNLHLYDTYGEGDYRRKLIHLLKEAIKDGKIINMSPGYQKINLLHINDVIDGLYCAIKYILRRENSFFDTFSLRSKKSYSIRELVEMINEISDENLQVNWGALEYRKRTIMDISEYPKTLPHWKEKVELRGALKEFMILED